MEAKPKHQLPIKKRRVTIPKTCMSCKKRNHVSAFAASTNKTAIWLCRHCMKHDTESPFLCDICGSELRGYKNGAPSGMEKSHSPKEFIRVRKHLVCGECWFAWAELGY